MAGEPRPVTVLYVAGWMYSGSTFLGRVLGELDGAFGAGEAIRFWELYRRERQCGCGGSSRRTCPVWTAVSDEVAKETEDFDGARVEEIGLRFRLNRRLGATLLAIGGRGSQAAAMREFRAQLEALYRGIARVTGCHVVVDTSKSPIYAAILESVLGIDLRVVHLVRDPRGSLLSSAQRGHPFVGPGSSLALWSLSHLAFELGWRPRGPGRYRLVRYEDFARQPRATVRELARFAGLDGAALPFEGPASVMLGTSHMISGNRLSRFGSGLVGIEADQEWRTALGPLRQAAATALTWPLLVAYGYPTIPPRPPAAAHRAAAD